MGLVCGLAQFGKERNSGEKINGLGLDMGLKQKGIEKGKRNDNWGWS